MKVKITPKMRYYIKLEEDESIPIYSSYVKLNYRRGSNSEYDYTLSVREYNEMINDRHTKINNVELVNRKEGDVFYDIDNHENFTCTKLKTIIPKYEGRDCQYDLIRYELQRDGQAYFSRLFEVYGFDYSVYLRTITEKEYKEFIKITEGEGSVAKNLKQEWESAHTEEKEKNKKLLELKKIEEGMKLHIKLNKEEIIKENKEIIEANPFYCGFVDIRPRDRKLKKLLSLKGTKNLDLDLYNILPPYCTQSMDIKLALAKSVIKIIEETLGYKLYTFSIPD